MFVAAYLSVLRQRATLLDPYPHPLPPFNTQDMVTWLSLDVGWDEMARDTGIKCFASNPSIKSSLKVLRQKDNEWARQKVDQLYRRLGRRRE